MKNINIKARIKRNQFDVLAGEFYQDENTQIIKELNLQGKKALLGIQREDKIYTVIGESSVYYSTNLGVEGEISHEEFLKFLQKNAINLGKKGIFEFVSINEQDVIWVLNGPTMNAMWNTILLLHNNKK